MGAPPVRRAWEGACKHGAAGPPPACLVSDQFLGAAQDDGGQRLPQPILRLGALCIEQAAALVSALPPCCAPAPASSSGNDRRQGTPNEHTAHRRKLIL